MLVMTNMISIGLMIITMGMIYLLLRYFEDNLVCVRVGSGLSDKIR